MFSYIIIDRHWRTVGVWKCSDIDMIVYIHRYDKDKRFAQVDQSIGKNRRPFETAQSRTKRKSRFYGFFFLLRVREQVEQPLRDASADFRLQFTQRQEDSSRCAPFILGSSSRSKFRHNRQGSPFGLPCLLWCTFRDSNPGPTD